MRNDRRTTVFVASTSEDLADYRKVAGEVIVRCGWHPEMMEHWGASPHPSVAECRSRIARCQLLLLIVAGRRGWVPSVAEDGDGIRSITELELEHALKLGIPTLALLCAESWPRNRWERDPLAQAQVDRFREELKKRVVVFFDHETEQHLPKFGTLLLDTLVNYKLSTGALAEGEQADLTHVDPACNSLLSGQAIPFIGPGIYGDGPLSSRGLLRALVGRDVEDRSLATVAEQEETRLGSREYFLRGFRAVLGAEATLAEPSLVHRVLASAPRPAFYVDTTFDLGLVQQLTHAGRQCVVLAHIIRAADELEAGKILKWRPDGTFETCRADAILVDRSECVIYKPLGSPLFGVDAPLELDTVVVTETDHSQLLSRLPSAEEGVPAIVKGGLTRSALLFIGYSLDVWQYRLVMQLLKIVAKRSSDPATRAVRLPDGEVERVAWDRLNARVVPLTVEKFARLALERMGLPDGNAGHALG